MTIRDGTTRQPAGRAVTGAWRPGDDPGHRQFFTFATDRRLRPRQRRRPDRRHRRLRDVGHARRRTRRNAVLLCHAWTGDSHVAGPGRAGPSDAGLVGGYGRARATDRHRPLVRRVPQRARRVPGLDRARRRRTRRRHAVRLAVPGHHDPRHGARPGPPGRPPRHRRRGTPSSAARWAGCRCSSGRSCTPTGSRSIVPIATCMQATAQQIAWGAIGRRAIALDPRWRGGDYYDAAAGDGPAEGLADRPHGRPGDVPQRQRVHRPLRSRPRRPGAARRHVRAVAAVRGRALPRAPRHEARRAASTPTATSSSARRWTSTTSPGAAGTWRRRWPGSRARACRSGSRPTCCIRATSSARSTSCCARRAPRAEYVEIDSPHGHDAFLINLDQLADPIADFLGPSDACRRVVGSRRRGAKSSRTAIILLDVGSRSTNMPPDGSGGTACRR